jgi:hypothetical protein
MAFSIKFNEEKNQLLKATRNISFEDALKALQEKRLLANIKHPYQQVYIIQIKEYAYAVPYILNVGKKEIFLKTIYPSRFFTKKYLKGGEYEEIKK